MRRSQRRSDAARRACALRPPSADDEVGDALDRMAKVPTIAGQLVLAAKSAFRDQHSWYQLVMPMSSIAL
jgi:hypothetical protein